MFIARVLLYTSHDAKLAILAKQSFYSEKKSGSERDSNPRPLRRWYSALPTELSKPHESGVCGLALYVDVILGPSIVRNEISFVH